MKVNDLLSGYEADFFSKTGKGLEFKIVNKWLKDSRLPRMVDLELLILMILDCTKWEKSHIMSTKRDEEYVFKKHFIYYILYHNGHSLSKISRYFKVCHTSVLNGAKKFEIRLDTQEQAQTTIEKVSRFLKNNLENYESID